MITAFCMAVTVFCIIATIVAPVGGFFYMIILDGENRQKEIWPFVQRLAIAEFAFIFFAFLCGR